MITLEPRAFQVVNRAFKLVDDHAIEGTYDLVALVVVMHISGPPPIVAAKLLPVQ